MEDLSTVMFERKTQEVRRAIASIWELFIIQDSPTVMFEVKITEVKSALEYMWELFMKENSPTVMFGRILQKFWS